MKSDRLPACVFKLVAAGEPFRLLFPLGTVLGITGVLLWPLFGLGVIGIYPSVAHSHIMIQGFVSSFIIGFLGTALPRLLDVPRVGLRATVLLGCGLILLTFLHLIGWQMWGNAVFIGLLIGFLILLGMRSRQRQDTPPPGFVLVALGMICGLVGTALLLLDNFLGGTLSGEWYTFARLLALHGYLLFPVMGVSAFLLPRFFGLPNRHSFAEMLKLTPQWKQRAAFAAVCGVIVVISFALEAIGWVRTGNGLRAAVVLFYLLREVPLHRTREARGSLVPALFIALGSVPTGYFLIALFPVWQLGLVHIVFITGFGLITLTVASRVLLGHSGQSGKFKLVLVPVVIMTASFVVAMLVRIIADFIPGARFQLYSIAAVIWIAGIVIWGAGLLPAVRYADNE